MKYLFSILLILSFLPTNVFAESERPQAIVIPISSMGAVTKSQKQILQNTLEDNLKSYFTLISQELFEKAQEKAFEELDYEECTEDQCIMLIQEMLQVENAFHLQVIREGQNTQLSLSWRTLDEKKKETDVCRNCDTFEINDRIEKLILLITGKTKEEPKTVSSGTITSANTNSWLRIATVGPKLISIYYKFLDDIGLGLSRISSLAEDSTKPNDKVVFYGTFINLGYDYDFGNLVLNTNLGLVMSGHAESTLTMKISELETGGSYTLFIMVGYKGSGEYGLGLNTTNFKQNNEDYPTVSTETRPVLWVGFNW